MRLGPLEVTFLPTRVRVFGRRVHHGLLGLLLCAHDARDCRHWLPDFLRHPDARR